jgi:ribulose bisphosphate carboxylase small subunit
MTGQRKVVYVWGCRPDELDKCEAGYRTEPELKDFKVKRGLLEDIANDVRQIVAQGYKIDFDTSSSREPLDQCAFLKLVARKS